MKSRQWKDNMAKAAIYISAAFSVIILAIIIGFIVVKGIPKISIDFLTHNYEDKTTYVTLQQAAGGTTTVSDDRLFNDTYGITLSVNEEGLVVEKIASDSIMKQGVDGTGAVYAVKTGDIITKLGSFSVDRELKKNTDTQEILN